MDSVDAVREAFDGALAEAATPQDVEAVRVGFLGKSGSITALLKNSRLVGT